METVREHCKHKDCYYRGRFGSEPACLYILHTGMARKCSISECDKYKKGKARVGLTDYRLVYEEDYDL